MTCTDSVISQIDGQQILKKNASVAATLDVHSMVTWSSLKNCVKINSGFRTNFGSTPSEYQQQSHISLLTGTETTCPTTS